MPALTTPINAPPAMKPEARRVPLSFLALLISSSFERVLTNQLTRPPTSNGAFNSKGMNIPRENARAGTPSQLRRTARTAPTP